MFREAREVGEASRLCAVLEAVSALIKAVVPFKLWGSDEPETEDASSGEAVSCFGINVSLSS